MSYFMKDVLLRIIFSLWARGMSYFPVCMYVCMYVCMCLCVYVYMCVCMYVCMCLCVYVCMCLCVYVCIYVCVYVCMYVCGYVYMYVCMYVCVCVYVSAPCMHVYFPACMPDASRGLMQIIGFIGSRVTNDWLWATLWVLGTRARSYTRATTALNLWVTSPILLFKKYLFQPGVVAHAFNPRTQEAEAGKISEFETSLVYKVSSRTARTRQRNPVLKNKQTNKQTNEQNQKAIYTYIYISFSSLSLCVCMCVCACV
jgi:hypothetical protein